ncbi:MAG: GMC family oxidoreductase [Rubrobacteraceae bacterium]
MTVARKRKPERAEVCIIGAGASGAAAAKVLTESGARVVALERGPWRTRESFGGDELANVNRYNLWPDPLLNPRTVRFSESEEPEVELFCPVPQMVGGGTVHWQGWLPRFIEDDFRLRTIVGNVPGATLADWPIGYSDLEPYYDKVEWAFGVSGRAGANAFESPRSRDYPCPPMPVSRYARKFHEGCRNLGYNSFQTPQAALSRPYNGRPATVVSAFAQQHGDPTGTRSSALNVFVPDAVATGRYDLRPDSYVREITVDERGRAKSAVYEDADGDLIEQEADVIILACGAVESARLLLLSRSGRFPNGLANGSDLVGRNVTFHEYSAAVGIFDDPIYAWAGGGYVSASSFQFYEHDDDRGFVGGGHIAAAGVGIPLPINWSLPDAPAWGAGAKQIDRDFFNHSMAVSMVVHDMPQHDNRVELDENVKDAWGLPAARITLSPHENDLAMGRFLIDRNAEILEAAGAKKVDKVYIDRITGNCSHQHSTTRMGDDPETSVLNKWCQAHEVDNLFVVDGGPFPTATGANPTLTIMANAWRVAENIVRQRGAVKATSRGVDE